jgi:glycosyltransferase involved in cell wall biosynthesis
VYGTAERALSHLADAIICVSGEELDHALHLGIDRAKLHLVPNGVNPLADVRRADVRHHLALEPDELCIGYVGRLEAGKAVDRLLHAFAEVRRQQPRTRLALVGAGPEEAALRSLGARLNVADAVTFVGAGDGRTLMAGFDVFAFASLYEGFPYVLLEAAQRGLPIVTTKVGGADQIVANGATGYVVAQDDAASFAQCLLRVCSDAGLRTRMGTAAADLVQQWTTNRMLDDTIQVYSAAERVRQDLASRPGTFKRLLKA